MMVIITGLRFVERNIPVDADPPMLRRILQQRVAEIWFEVERGTLVMKDKTLGWTDVPMESLTSETQYVEDPCGN